MIGAALSPRFATYTHVYLLKIGVDPECVFLNAGIEFNQNQEYNKPLSPAEVSRLFNAAAREADDDCFGLNMGWNFSYESAGLAVLVLTSAPNVEKGLYALLSGDRYVDNAIDQRLDRGKATFTHSFRVMSDEDLDLRHFHENVTVMLYRMLYVATRREFNPVSAFFTHEQGAPIERYVSLLGTTDIRFGQDRNGVEYPNAILSLPFVTANKLLHSIVTNSLKTYGTESAKNEFTEIVCREMMRVASGEIPMIETIASNLSVSPRTLRRNLMEEGQTFSQVKRMALEKRSKYLLEQTNLSLAEISYEMGYSEVSAFCRAFRGWTGRTPKSFRKEIGADSDVSVQG